MKKLLISLCMTLFCITMMADVVYKFDSTNSPVSGSAGPISNLNATIDRNTGNYTFQDAKNGAIKFSKATFKVTLPSTAKVYKMYVNGYSNSDSGPCYLSKIAGTSYGSSVYTFPSRTDGTWKSYTIEFSTPLTGSFEFTVADYQGAFMIELYSSEDETEESKYASSIGKYSNPVTTSATPTGASKVFEWTTPASMMEKLDRGLVAVPEMNGKGMVVTWRLFGTDGLGKASKTTFDVYRNGECIKSGLSTVTNYTDAEGTRNDVYSLKVRVDGVVTETTNEVEPWKCLYKTIQLDRPAGGTIASWNGSKTDYVYTPNDMSVGDLDGDGEYEIVVKWDPTTSQDNSLSYGYSGDVYLDAYKMDGTKLWRVSLGKNIRAGAHYTQFLVYDFDGDGKAEMICKTASGSIDGAGNYVTEAATDETIKNTTANTKDYRNSGGHILSGEEYLTVFNGETGAAMHTIWYSPSRSLTLFPKASTSYTSSWGDAYGNRGERFNAAVAYLDGKDKLPSAVMQRGYYTQAFFWAVDWDGKELSTKWLHYGNSSTTWSTYNASGKVTHNGTGKSSFGQGVHGISVGDVNGDGYDEIVMGSATITHDGQLLCSTSMGHGDAIHLADLCPDRDGLEVMMPHEEKGGDYGYDVHDATTGEFIKRETGTTDNGRGMAADVLASNRGYEYWSSQFSDVYSCVDGSSLGSKKPSTNFRIYWDGDLQDELFDGKYSTSESMANATNGTSSSVIEKMVSTTTVSTLLSFGGDAYGNGQTCNTTKATPCLQADILGDWREELILWNQNDPSQINIYTSNVPSTFAVPCLMHDHVYRMGVAWQNSAYNQPPHLGYYLPDMFDADYGIYTEAYATGVKDVNAAEQSKTTNGKMYNLAGMQVSSSYHGIVIKDGKKYVK